MAIGNQPSLSKFLHDFLEENRIKTSDVNKFVHYITEELGAYEFEDLKGLRIEQLKEELTGLKPLQQSKFLNCLKKLNLHKSSGYDSDDDSFSITTSSSAFQSCSNTFSQPVVVDAMNNPKIKMMVRYVLCRDLFTKIVKERVILNLSLTTHNIRDLMDLIRGQESIESKYDLELFTHEGYPMNVNEYNDECPLLKWSIQNASLVYVFSRPTKQAGIVSLIDTKIKKMNYSQGTHTLKVHSFLYGEFSISIDLKKDTGLTIKQKIFSCKEIHPNCFNLFTRPSNYESECIDKWSNLDVQKLEPSNEDTATGSHIIELMMITSETYKCRNGIEYCFGKCTYTPIIEQSDAGFAKFYSILYTMIHVLSKEKQKKILVFVDKEFSLPPLTYALKLLFADYNLVQFPCWVALIEGCYQLFHAILSEYFIVPDSRVFECSDYIWGMICRQSDKLANTLDLNWKTVSLYCSITHTKMVEPVTAPRCDHVYEKLNVLQKMKTNTAVIGCEVKELTKEKLLPATDISRLMMLSGFQDYPSFLTWEKNCEIEKYFRIIELPPDVDWEYICDSNAEYQVERDMPSNSTGYLVYYRKYMAVYLRVIKDIKLSRELYDPLYDPTLNRGNVTLDTADLKTSLESSSNMDLKKCVSAKIKAGVVHHLSKANESNPGRSTSVPKIIQAPIEAIVVVLDISTSMSEYIFKDEGKDFSRLTAAKQLFQAFLDRTEAFSFHHAVGLVSCSTKPAVKVPITDDYKTFMAQINNLSVRGSTALYDSMDKAVSLLIEVKVEYPGCKRRILCLTDGKDNNSICGLQEIFKKLQQHEIMVDSVLVTGSLGNINQKAISHGTGGFCFYPQTMAEALKIFETETLLSFGIRQLRMEPLLDSIHPYQDIKHYPYNCTKFYGQEDLRTQFACDLRSANYTNPARIVQHSTMFGIGTALKSSTPRIQRILLEIRQYLKDPHPSIDIYPQENNITRWKIILIGPEKTPYEEGTFILYAKFPTEYPQMPPEIRFETPIYHCNINSNGRICHSSLDTKYFPKQTVKNILNYIFGLLMDPEPGDPLDSVLALELKTNRVQYEARARQIVAEFAKKTDRAAYRKEIVAEDGEAPESLVCPLTRKLFVDPVITEHGHTYERSALMDYLKNNRNMDPKAQKPVDIKQVRPIITIKEMVATYKKTVQQLR